MQEITKHPLYSVADRFKRAFLIQGFELFDNGTAPELIPVERSSPTYSMTEEFYAKPILLNEKNYQLRSEQLFVHLKELKGSLPLKKFCCGTVYDEKDLANPSHLRIEGIFARKDFSFKEYEQLWSDIVQTVYGLHTSCKLQKHAENVFSIQICPENKPSYSIGCTGTAAWIARALLDMENDDTATWMFTIDLDTAALHAFHYADRNDLYHNSLQNLSINMEDSSTVGNDFISRVDNLMRSRGYTRFTGMKLYQKNCYKKMHMIQDEWDANNKGISLVNGSEQYASIPTVLTPALEQALADVYLANAESAKIYDIAHIFLPSSNGSAPIEKTSLCIGAFGSEWNSRKFKAEIDAILSELGIQNHFFFPTNVAIAYDTKDTWLVLDEKLHYLDGNFGGINEIAEKNHEIGVHCFMANFELPTLEKKYLEEYHFIPAELL